MFFWMKHSKKHQEVSQPVTTESELQEDKESLQNTFKRKEIPDRNAPISEWEEFVATNDWEQIHAVFMKFVPMVNDEQDHKIWTLLHSHLCKIESPFLSSHFIKYYEKEIITVEQNCSIEQIKNAVEELWPKISAPCFVIKTNGELVGFALSPSLIIVGVTPVACSAKNALANADCWDKKLLTKEDCVVLEKNFSHLNLLMRCAQVPHINCSDWLIAPQENTNRKTYEGYDMHHADRIIRYSSSDYTNILVKL